MVSNNPPHINVIELSDPQTSNRSKYSQYPTNKSLQRHSSKSLSRYLCLPPNMQG